MQRRLSLWARLMVSAVLFGAGVGITTAFGKPLAAAVIAVLCCVTAIWLDWALTRSASRGRLSPGMRMGLWLAIPAAGILLVSGRLGQDNVDPGVAILLGPTVERLRTAFQSRRVRRAIGSLERLIGFNDVPTDVPAIGRSAGAVSRGQSSNLG